MQNITENIKQAINANVLWSVNEFYLFLETAKEKQLEIDYWDGEENWAAISANNESIGYVWKKYPLAVISKNGYVSIKKLFEKFDYMVPIIVSTISSEELIIDADPELIDRFGYFPYNKAASASDFWFFTAT